MECAGDIVHYMHTKQVSKPEQENVYEVIPDHSCADVAARHGGDFAARHGGDVTARHGGDVTARHGADVTARRDAVGIDCTVHVNKTTIDTRRSTADSTVDSDETQNTRPDSITSSNIHVS